MPPRAPSTNARRGCKMSTLRYCTCVSARAYYEPKLRISTRSFLQWQACFAPGAYAAGQNVDLADSARLQAGDRTARAAPLVGYHDHRPILAQLVAALADLGDRDVARVRYRAGGELVGRAHIDDLRVARIDH